MCSICDFRGGLARLLWRSSKEENVFKYNTYLYNSLIFICTGVEQPFCTSSNARCNNSCLRPLLLRPAYPSNTCSSDTRKLITMCWNKIKNTRFKHHNSHNCNNNKIITINCGNHDKIWIKVWHQLILQCNKLFWMIHSITGNVKYPILTDCTLISYIDDYSISITVL